MEKGTIHALVLHHNLTIISLFTSKNDKLLKSLCKFIEQAFKVSKEFINQSTDP